MLSLVIGYMVILVFIGISSYYSIGTVRITPTQTDDAIFGYLAPNVYAKKKIFQYLRVKKYFLRINQTIL